MDKNIRIDVSVIIPIYNVAKYLPDTIQYLMNQTYRNFEVICVDDHSSDESYQMLRNYQKSFEKLHVIRNAQNQGAGECRNIGLEEAVGEYVLFLDADDEFENHLVEKLYTYARKQNADTVIYYTGHFTDGESIRYIPDRKGKNKVYMQDYPVINSPGEQPNLYELITNSPFDKLVKRQILLEHHIRFPKYPHTNDMCYSYESVLCANKVVYLDEVLYFHRRDRKGSITSNFAHIRSYIVNVLEDIYVLEKERGISTVQERAYWKFALHRIYQALYMIPVEHRDILLRQAHDFLNQYYVPFREENQGYSILSEKLWEFILSDNVTRKYSEILRESQLVNWRHNKSWITVWLNCSLANALDKKDKLTDYYIDEEELNCHQIVCIAKRLLYIKLRKVKYNL